ncbi:hypothetical protein [Butyrivibrio sp. FCS006]|uniref:hypothetical protein n=1 Tax=Butyrivibrio sp. FCS006 TaxID=1280684 RepID=UPI000402229C|nr:hypothetical protein [Butyrivibrio sp. FCS006]
MQNKRILAAFLVATMVIGSSLTAFAEGPVTSGGTEGEGTSEGHVNKHIISVTLPTIVEGATPFAYTMDPERLVNETNAAKYAAGSNFTDDAKANGVYFTTDTNKYDDKSNELKAVSQSSADVKLIVEVETEASTNDIPLVDEAPALSGDNVVTDPQLYLALKVDDTTKAVKSDEKVTIETTIAGKDANFQTEVESGNYVYKAKTGDDITWNAATIQMSGVVSKASAEGLTAPTLKVTWKYEDPAEEPEGTEVSAVAASGENDLLIRLVSGVNADASKISAVKVNGTDVDEENIAVSGSGNVWLKGVVTDAGIYNILITYDGTTYKASYTKE